EVECLANLALGVREPPGADVEERELEPGERFEPRLLLLPRPADDALEVENRSSEVTGLPIETAEVPVRRHRRGRVRLPRVERALGVRPRLVERPALLCESALLDPLRMPSRIV